MREQLTPPQTPTKTDTSRLVVPARNVEVLERPYYGLIVDGVHSHPNSVRVGSVTYEKRLFITLTSRPLACIFILP
jgi:N-acetylglucosamine-6-phosphate deacetylase